MEALLSILIPSVVAVVGVIIANAFSRRSSKEQNTTSAFKVVTDQLFALNDELNERLEEVKKKVSELESIVSAQASELEKARGERDTAKRVNAGLAAYVKKLLLHWPTGSTPPGPDEALDWETHL